MRLQKNHIVFASRKTRISGYFTESPREITFGVYIDLSMLDALAYKASRNKSRKAKDGPIFIEVHTCDIQK